MQREDLASREKWHLLDKQKDNERLEEIRKERAEILVRMARNDENHKKYAEEHVVAPTAEEDARTQQKWEDYLQVRSNEMPE
jgi:flagellar biosynthesis/type III secretory pathway chaperone